MGKTLFLLSQSQLMHALKTNDTKVLKQFYLVNYVMAESFVLKNGGTLVNAKAVYQEAFILAWTNVKNGRFTPQNETALQNYLYQIAKNKWTDLLRSKSDKAYKNITLRIVRDEEYKAQKINKIEMAMAAFKNLGKPCQQLLKTFYFEKKSIKSIASKLNIAESAIRKEKFNCMQKLHNLILDSKKHTT